MAIPILGNILQIAAVVFCAGAVVCAGLVASLSSAFVSGVTSGKLGYALRAGLISAVTAVAFYAVGTATASAKFDASLYTANIAGHAAVGCLSTAASGGSCGSGALSGAVGSAATPLINAQFPNPNGNTNDYFGGAAASSVVGGLASVAGGGKFVNGAATAAFGYLFNDAAHNCFTHCDANGAEPGIRNADGVFGLLVPALRAGSLVLDALSGGFAAEGIAADTSLLGQSFGKLGTVVENPGLDITGFTDHGINQAITRGVSPQNLLSTVNNPSVVLQQSGGQYLFLSNEAGVVLSPAGRVITTYPSSMFGPGVSGVLRSVP